MEAVYAYIKAALAEHMADNKGLPVAPYFGQWSEENQAKEEATGAVFPAILIQLQRGEFEQQSGTSQHGTRLVTLHLGVERYDNDETALASLWALYAEVHTALKRYRDNNISFPVRQSDELDTTHSAIYQLRVTYKVGFYDC